MFKSMMMALAMLGSLAVPPAGAAEQQQKTHHLDSLGGGGACKDGKCGNRAGGKGGCCCAGMMGKMQGDQMEGHDPMAMDHDGMGMDHGMGDRMDREALLERVRKLEERVDTLQKMLSEQKSRS